MHLVCSHQPVAVSTLLVSGRVLLRNGLRPYIDRGPRRALCQEPGWSTVRLQLWLSRSHSQSHRHSHRLSHSHSHRQASITCTHQRHNDLQLVVRQCRCRNTFCRNLCGRGFRHNMWCDGLVWGVDFVATAPMLGWAGDFFKSSFSGCKVRFFFYTSCLHTHQLS